MSKNIQIAAGADGFMFRNRIINGDMRIDQRNEGTNPGPLPSSTYTIDRWYTGTSTASLLYTLRTSSPGTSIPFPYSILIAGTSTAHTAAAGDVFNVYQTLEGCNISDLQWGTANAKPVTLSFYFYAVTAGTYCCSLQSYTGSSSTQYSYVIPFTVTANTTNYLTFTVPGCTVGTWNNTIATAGMLVRFDVGSGTSFQTSTTNSWVSGTFITTSGCVSVVNGTAGQNVYISGVQLEAGTIATPFEVRPYAVELALCQRYYEKAYSTGIVPGTASYTGAGYEQYYLAGVSSATFTPGIRVPYKISKMTVPTIVTYAYSTATSGKARDVSNGSDVNTSSIVGTNGFTWNATTSAATTTINIVFYWTASAEL